jgi:hypothetical protein
MIDEKRKQTKSNHYKDQPIQGLEKRVEHTIIIKADEMHQKE